MNNVGYLLNKAALLLKWNLGQRLTEHDLTVPQWSVLRDLYAQERLPEQERRNTAAHVSERLLSDRPTVSGIVERLAGKGLIRKESNPSDKRSHILRLTPDAQRLIPRLEESSQDSVTQALKGFTKVETGVFLRSLAALIHNLEQT